MRNSATFPAGDITLLKKKLVRWAGNFSCALFIDHNNYRNFHPGLECIAAAGAIDSISPHSGNAFPGLAAFFNQHKDWLFGYLSYDLKNEVEPALLSANPEHNDDIKFPVAHFFRPRHIVKIAGDQLFIESTENPNRIFENISNTVISDYLPPPSGLIRQRMKKEEYMESVRKLHQHISDGDLYEVNLCQEFYIENYSANPIYLYERLNAINPAPFASFLKFNDHYLLSASPERFLKKVGNKITSQPMKGTLRRDHATSDFSQQEKLRYDPKERAENVMIVDLVRNDLARSAVPGSVKVEELFGVYTFPTVHQMVSTISATLRPEVHFATAIKNAFPMGSMTGAPKIKAMQLIDQYEKTNRGLFSGTVGFITPAGDFDFNVVIRSFLYNASSKYLSFQTGSAITYDSIPEKEYEECLLKAKALIAALQ